jgi:hypothetical protein
MKTIHLIASELAKLTGHNRFESAEKTLNTILKRNGLSDVYVPKTRVEESLMKLDTKSIETIKKELKLPVSATVSDIEKNIKKTVIKDSLDKDITESASKDKVDKILKTCPTLMKTLDKGIKEDLQMKRGNVKEDNNLNITEKKADIVITSRNSEMFNRILYEDPEGKYQINVRGKVDGLTNDTIVETKNRTKRLFHRIPGYEQVQLEAYMFLTGYKMAIHVECYNDEQIKTDYKHIPEFWEECLQKIVKYIDTKIPL